VFNLAATLGKQGPHPLVALFGLIFATFVAFDDCARSKHKCH
jgi:hypothetical protein